MEVRTSTSSKEESFVFRGRGGLGAIIYKADLEEFDRGKRARTNEGEVWKRYGMASVGKSEEAVMCRTKSCLPYLRIYFHLIQRFYVCEREASFDPYLKKKML